MEDKNALATSIGQRLRKLRLDQHLSQEALARSAEISRETVRRIEAGQCVPGTQTLSRIAGALHVGVDFFTADPTQSFLRGEIR